jgi:hypothetical protein
MLDGKDYPVVGYSADGLTAGSPVLAADIHSNPNVYGLIAVEYQGINLFLSSAMGAGNYSYLEKLTNRLILMLGPV